MTRTADSDVDLFRAAVARRLGLEFEDRRRDTLRDVLEERIGATRSPSAESYVALLLDEGDPSEANELAPALSVGETYFFRNQPQLDAFADLALPQALARTGGRGVRVLSAGCASGEEAYSIAMTVHERHPEAARRVSVVGIDMNAPQIERARAGVYGDWSLRGTGPERRERLFETAGGSWRVRPEIARAVSFEARNLLDDDDTFWAPGAFDVVFCRNVLIYFTPGARRKVLGHFERAIPPGGHLFLGHAETPRGLSDCFEVQRSGDAFFYRRCAGPTPRAASRRAEPGSTFRPSTPTAPASSAPAPTAAPPAPPPRPASTMEPAEPAQHDDRPSLSLIMLLGLIRDERFDEALAAIDHLAASPPVTALLARGALLAVRGATEEAEALCRRILGVDADSPDGHYLLAFCRQEAGDEESAFQEYARAAFLDPFFALAHLQLGMLARRARDFERSERELRQALARLPEEDELRVVLFGGGFTRAALVQLCRAELAAAGRGR